MDLIAMRKLLRTFKAQHGADSAKMLMQESWDSELEDDVVDVLGAEEAAQQV